MPRRYSPAQAKSKLRQIERDINREINKINSANKRAAESYKREVRAYNSRVRANRHRLHNEIAKLNSRQTTTFRYTTYQTSVQTLQRSFAHIEAEAEYGTWTAGADLFDMAEGETANSVAVLNALLAEPAIEDADDPTLQQTAITSELRDISPDLDARWRGALYALSPRNPDAARHFCTSSREIFTTFLETQAPDDAVKAANSNYVRTPNGGVSRRARILYFLSRHGQQSPGLADFIDDDVENVITLFDDFNSGAHGQAGLFDVGQLVAIKTRVEGAIQFLHRIALY